MDPSAPRFFGFAEFVGALALLVLAWTTTDARYQFRIATAFLPLRGLTFLTVSGVGVLTLSTDLWRAEGWLVPQGHLFTSGTWQGLLGAVFLLTFLCWAWFAFVRPPVFGKRNAKRFGNFLFLKISEGSPSEMAILAQELRRSIPALVTAAPNLRRHSHSQDVYLTKHQEIANDIFLLLGDPRFCRAMVASSPGTIFCLFQEMACQKKFGLAVSQLARNTISSAIDNKDSFLYHEDKGYYTGLLGYLRPISQSIFGNSRMVEEVGSLFDADYRMKHKWTALEWDAFNRAVLITLTDHVKTNFWNHSFVLTRSFDDIGEAASDLYKINGTDGSWDDDSVQRLRASVDFCKEALKILDEAGPPEGIHWRIRKGDPFYYQTIYDALADLIINLMEEAATVKKPWGLAWAIQHNSIWSQVFDGLGKEGGATKVVRFKLRRKIYDEIVSASDWPNFKNIKLLGYCLNVMGLEVHQGSFGREYRALQRAVLAWTQQNYAALEAKAPNVFEDCLPDGLSYEKANCRLVKTLQATAFRVKPENRYFNLARPPRRRATTKRSGSS